MPKTIKGTVPAYATAKSCLIDVSALHKAHELDQEQKNHLLSYLTLTTGEWIKEDGDYIPVGTVEMVFTPCDTNTMVQGQVDALRAERTKVMAEAQRKVTAIEDQISKLQALTFDADEAMAGEQEID